MDIDRAVQVCQEIRGGVLQLKDVAKKEVEKYTYSDRWWLEGQIEAYDEVLQLIDSVTPDQQPVG